jgi:diadenylate cyclase
MRRLREAVACLAPGTALRDGLERILRGRTGALIVLGYDQTVEAICDGGFSLDVRYAPTRLWELSKMDRGIGNPPPLTERTAIQTGYPVISLTSSPQ